MIINQQLSKKMPKKIKKSMEYIWSVCENRLLLHPLSRTRAATKWHSERCGSNESQVWSVFRLHSARKASRAPTFVKQCFTKYPRKRKSKKTSKKFGRYVIKSLSLHPLSERKAFVKKKRSMKRLHKQYVVQERRNEDCKIWFLRVKKNRQCSFLYIYKERAKLRTSVNQSVVLNRANADR